EEEEGGGRVGEEVGVAERDLARRGRANAFDGEVVARDGVRILGAHEREAAQHAAHRDVAAGRKREVVEIVHQRGQWCEVGPASGLADRAVAIEPEDGVAVQDVEPGERLTPSAVVDHEVVAEEAAPEIFHAVDDDGRRGRACTREEGERPEENQRRSASGHRVLLSPYGGVTLRSNAARWSSPVPPSRTSEVSASFTSKVVTPPVVVAVNKMFRGAPLTL